MKWLSSLALILLTLSSFAQNIPSHPNVTDAKGLRQGKWVLYFDSFYEVIPDTKRLMFYRTIEYKDDKPVGVVHDHLYNGKLFWEGTLLTDRPQDITDKTKPERFFAPELPANIPEHPNALNANGLRHGWWTIVINAGIAEHKKTDSSNYIRYYRVMEFVDGKPVGVAKDYFLTGVLYRELSFTSYRPFKNGDVAEKIDYERPIHIYWEDGSENLIASNRMRFAMHQARGQYELALPYAEEALKATEKLFGKKNYRYSYFLNSIGALYLSMGNYAKAEPFLLESIATAKELAVDIWKITPLMTLYQLYIHTGNNSKLLPLAEQLLLLRGEQYGKNSSAYAAAVGDLGLAYYLLKDYKKAQPLLEQAITMKRQAFGTDDLSSSVFINLAGSFIEQGKYSKAEPLLMKSLETMKKEATNKEKPGLYAKYYNLCLGSLGRLSMEKGNYSEAQKFYDDRLSFVENSFGKQHPNYNFALIAKANLLEARGNYKEAEPLYQSAVAGIHKAIETFFPSFSDSEKEAYYRQVKSVFTDFNSFCILRSWESPAILSDLYNNQLATKALLLNSSSKWKQRIRNSGDKKLFGIYTDWEVNQAILSRMYKDNKPNQRKNIDSLEQVTNAQEKELSRRSEMFATLSEKKKSTWTDIKSKLKPNEVAIEMIRVNKYGISKMVTDSSDVSFPRYKVSGITDTVYYAALLVTNTSTVPELVLFANGNALEKKYIKGYSNSIKSQIEDKESYNQFWKPIADKLNKLYRKKELSNVRIYFSPDGVYNQINLNTLLNPATNKYLFEEVKVSTVTNTKDLLAVRKEEAYNNLAYLFGYPDYGVSLEDRNAMVKKERESQPVYYAVNLERGGADLMQLPGTKTEVENIAALMKAKGWQPEVLIGQQAMEETLKECFKPRVLHIATHGYFQQDDNTNQHPLLRSGLMLAGAGESLDGKKEDASEDGILTAYEAMNLNLDNTDLVVLSACETGLGENHNGEGVYGLQRAFKVAGTQTIVMSLWKVNDETTQQLMTAFYENWLKGETKRNAFEQAQLSLKAKHKAPYYWGAFVMVD